MVKVWQLLTPEQLTQLFPPERLAQFLMPARAEQLISAEDILLYLFSPEELIHDLLFIHLDLNEKERAILKAAVLQGMRDSAVVRETLRARIRAVLSALGKVSTSGGAEPGGTSPTAESGPATESTESDSDTPAS